ncbi:MAG TPA: acyl-CoA dehydrogenase family protein, partial [Solirubrobacteraceae bacterium]|nr:acyl-CoA dehydrogenase family protein [Solirubrobacteraceae bacterium]
MALTAPSGEWTDEQKSLRKSLNQHFDALNAGHLEDDAANRFNRQKWQLIRDAGVIRIPFAEQWGGLGHDVLTLVYVLENLGYGCRDTGLLFALATQVVSAAIPLQKFGSDELKERYLARLIDGEVISAHAISEPNAGSDATAMITTATEDGDAYILDGKKIWITSGPLADIITVYAKTGTEGGAAGITAFLVPTDTPGFHVGEPIEKLGLNTCPFCELEFRDCRVPRENMLGKPGAGFFILEHVMNYEILCIFMMMAGEMEERMERCIKWAKSRQAFGQPIGSNQYVAGKIVDMKIALENSRKHLYDTARRFARGRNVTTEISMAKLITSEANVASALSAIQIFGARGYTR